MMDNKDDFKQVLKKFEEAQKMVHQIKSLEDFLSSAATQYINIKITYTTATSRKELVLTDEKWGVLDALHRSLSEYKRDFMKLWGGKNE